MAKHLRNRVSTGGGPRPDLRAERKQRADESNAKWRALTPAQQLQELALRPGESRRQTKRIIASM